jgi:hypothetical protein
LAIIEKSVSVSSRAGEDTRDLLVGNHFTKVGDVLFDSGDLHWPGSKALIRYPGGILSFRLGKGVKGVLEFLLKCRAVYMRRVSPRRRLMMADPKASGPRALGSRSPPAK